MLADPKLELVLRYLKHRWLRDIADQITGSEGEEILAFEDLDLDRDMIELARVTGTDLLKRFADCVLAAPGDLDLSGRALASLSPELEPSEAQIFLRIVALNLAFRLRTDELLAALCAYTASGPAPRLAPGVLGALLGRARSERDARALLEASPLSGDALEAALATVTLDDDDRMIEITREGAEPARAGRRGIFSGIHLLAPDLLRRLSTDRFASVVTEGYRPCMAEGRVYGHYVDAPWWDLGTPERYEAALKEFLGGAR